MVSIYNTSQKKATSQFIGSKHETRDGTLDTFFSGKNNVTEGFIIAGKKKQNISTSVVTEVLHELIDSIFFKNSTEKPLSFIIQNSKKIFKEEEDEIRRKSKKSRKESRKRKHKNFEHDHKLYKHRKKDEKSRNEFADPFFPDPKDGR